MGEKKVNNKRKCKSGSLGLQNCQVDFLNILIKLQRSFFFPSELAKFHSTLELGPPVQNTDKSL